MAAKRVELTVARWGNSLAVRLPSETARRIGITEGDKLVAEVAADGRLTLASEGRVIGKADTQQLRRFINRQKQSAPVVPDMRRSSRY